MTAIVANYSLNTASYYSRVNSLRVKTSYVYLHVHLCQVALETALKNCKINELFEFEYDTL